MIDTVNLMLLEQPEKCDLSQLTNKRTEVIEDTGQTIVRGKLSNLKIASSETCLKISGSIPKFLNGNNIQRMNRQDIKAALEAIEDTLSINLSSAFASRLDVAATIIMDYPVKAYYPYFGCCGRSEKMKNKNSIYFNLNRKQLIIYDKTKEAKTIPLEYQGKHLLKYECRFLNALPRQFKRGKIYAKDLYNPEFYSVMVERWKQEFSKIHFIEPYMNPEKITTPKEFKDYLVRRGIEADGFDIVYSMADNLKYMGMRKEYVYRIKKDLKGVAAMASNTSSLIPELKEKIFSY